MTTDSAKTAQAFTMKIMTGNWGLAFSKEVKAQNPNAKVNKASPSAARDILGRRRFSASDVTTRIGHHTIMNASNNTG